MKLEELLVAQQKQLEGVKGALTEDISRIRESVSGMIQEALIKRAQANQEKALKRSMLSASSDGDNSKDREREKIANHLKKVEEDFKVRVQELEEQNKQVQKEIEERKAQEEEMKRKFTEAER